MTNSKDLSNADRILNKQIDRRQFLKLIASGAIVFALDGACSRLESITQEPESNISKLTDAEILERIKNYLNQNLEIEPHVTAELGGYEEGALSDDLPHRALNSPVSGGGVISVQYWQSAPRTSEEGVRQNLHSFKVKWENGEERWYHVVDVPTPSVYGTLTLERLLSDGSVNSYESEYLPQGAHVFGNGAVHPVTPDFCQISGIQIYTGQYPESTIGVFNELGFGFGSCKNQLPPRKMSSDMQQYLREQLETEHKFGLDRYVVVFYSQLPNGEMIELPIGGSQLIKPKTIVLQGYPIKPNLTTLLDQKTNQMVGIAPHVLEASIEYEINGLPQKPMGIKKVSL